MKHTYASALSSGWPNCEWSLYNSDDFTTLLWLSDSEKPTLAQVTSKINELDLIEAKRLLRIKRNSLLQETDVRSLPDFPHKTTQEREAWLAYRQQLRDMLITANPTLDTNHELKVTSVQWPIKPT